MPVVYITRYQAKKPEMSTETLLTSVCRLTVTSAPRRQLNAIELSHGVTKVEYCNEQVNFVQGTTLPPSPKELVFRAKIRVKKRAFCCNLFALF
jgi:hypothetical protein